jgi:hypothetical protein
MEPGQDMDREIDKERIGKEKSMAVETIKKE